VASYALLVFAKQHLCDDSTMALFARERGLTNAEGQVLAQVCKGLRPAQIADHHGVQVSTVRTQLRSIRMKTCSDTIRELVQKVSVLPPMARHLATGPSPA
jgi:DNA-binding CsgD family transcriptional regulator